MNDSPWQPPRDGTPDGEPVEPASEPTLPPAPSSTTPSTLPPAAPAPAPPPPPSPWSPEGASTWTSTPPSDPIDAPVGGDEPPSRSGRSKLVVGGAVAAVAALGLAGLFAVQRFSAADEGGAATADDLGNELLAAIEAEDVLGVIDTMLPGERDTLGDPFVEMVGELQRLEVLSADTDLSALLGLDVELTGETVDVRATNVPDIVDVSLAADATVTIDGATLPLGDLVEQQLPDDALTELRGSRTTETDRLELELAAVRDGDRWYFSVFHTIAELARSAAGDLPIPDEGVPVAGADTPEGAVDQLLDRVEQLDLRGLIATLDPAEAAALQRYAPLFLDDAEAALADVPLDWRVDVRDFRVDGSGDERTVFVDALGITGELDGAAFSFRFADGCVRAELDGESIEQCGSAPAEGLDPVYADAPAVEAFVTSVTDAFSDMEPIGLELRRRDGAWFVSPLSTMTEAMLTTVRALDRSELERIVDDAEAAAGEFADLVFGGLGALGGGLAIGDGFVDELPIDDGFVDDGSIVTPPSDGPATLSPWDECAQQETAADAAACFEQYVERGEIDALSVPATLAHPECGLAELTWQGELYGLSDEEFAAALEVAVPCFEALVEAGEVEDWMLPFEVVNADCFEGRNWYTEFEDDAYNERVASCLDGQG